MALLCLAYFAAVGAALGAVALLVERAMAPRPGHRWVWMTTMLLSAVLPILSSVHHASGSIELWGREFVPLSAMSRGAAAGWLVCETPLGALLMRVWVVASLLLALVVLVDVVRQARLLRRAAARMGATVRVDGVPVIVADQVGPVTVGFWRARVVVPRWVLGMPAAQRRFILRHEDEHRRAGDTRLLGVGALLLCLMPWNVALWWQLRRLRLAVELDCDRRVVAALGDATAYGELLLRVAQAGGDRSRLQPALLGHLGMLESRLRALVAPVQRPRSHRVLAVAAATLVTYLVLAVPHPVPRPASSPVTASVHRH